MTIFWARLTLPEPGLRRQGRGLMSYLLHPATFRKRDLQARGSTAADQRFGEFMNGVDYLLRKIVDSSDPDISRNRARLYIALTAAKDVMSDGLTQARAAAEATDHWVREHPWRAIAIAAAVGTLVGLYATRRLE
jgi:ElaB/YqjD/DUF883 family membrane-anchored ribosome-binding protein